MDTISSVSYSRACGLVLTSKLPEVGAPWVDVEMAQQSWGRSKQNDLWYAAGGRREVRDVTPNPYQQRRLTSHGGTKHEDGSILLGLARRQADSGPAHDPRSCSQTHPTLALRSAIHTDGTPRFRVADLSGAIHRRRGHDGDSHMKESVSIWAILAMVAIVIGSGVAETIATRFLQ